MAPLDSARDHVQDTDGLTIAMEADSPTAHTGGTGPGHTTSYCGSAITGSPIQGPGQCKSPGVSTTKRRAGQVVNDSGLHAGKRQLINTPSPGIGITNPRTPSSHLTPAERLRLARTSRGQYSPPGQRSAVCRDMHLKMLDTARAHSSQEPSRSCENSIDHHTPSESIGQQMEFDPIRSDTQAFASFCRGQTMGQPPRDAVGTPLSPLRPPPALQSPCQRL